MSGVFGAVDVPTKYQPMILTASQRWNVSPAILAAQIQAESSFNEHSVSSAGAVGIAQFLPSTAQSYGVNPYDPASAIDGMAHLDSKYRDQFGSIDLALAAYNAGPGAVSKAGNQIPPFADTQNYVKKILGLAGDAGSTTDSPVSLTSNVSSFIKLTNMLMTGAFWKRIGVAALGILMILGATFFLLRQSKTVQEIDKKATEAGLAAAVAA